MEVIWRKGPRTRAWDELWRRLLFGEGDPTDEGCRDESVTRADI